MNRMKRLRVALFISSQVPRSAGSHISQFFDMLQFLGHQKIFYKTCMCAVKVAVNFLVIRKSSDSLLFGPPLFNCFPGFRARWDSSNSSSYRVPHRAQRPSPADVGVDQIRNKKLQIHACAHKRVYVFTVTDHRPPKGPFWRSVSVRLSID